jgi:hypothetical protein
MGRGTHDSNRNSFNTSHGTNTMALIINRVVIIVMYVSENFHQAQDYESSEAAAQRKKFLCA